MRRMWVVLLILLAGCSLARSAPECDPGTTPQQRGLSCDAAVNAALDRVDDRHTAIERIQFLYGCAKPCGNALQAGTDGPPPQGYVVFTYTDGEREYVAVTLGDHGVEVADPADY